MIHFKSIIGIKINYVLFLSTEKFAKKKYEQY
jgi:hypothetical protein